MRTRHLRLAPGTVASCRSNPAAPTADSGWARVGGGKPLVSLCPRWARSRRAPPTLLRGAARRATHAVNGGGLRVGALRRARCVADGATTSVHWCGGVSRGACGGADKTCVVGGDIACIMGGASVRVAVANWGRRPRSGHQMGRRRRAAGQRRGARRVCTHPPAPRPQPGNDSAAALRCLNLTTDGGGARRRCRRALLLLLLLCLLCIRFTRRTDARGGAGGPHAWCCCCCFR
jgi:hypothetical protein